MLTKYLVSMNRCEGKGHKGEWDVKVVGCARGVGVGWDERRICSSEYKKTRLVCDAQATCVASDHCVCNEDYFGDGISEVADGRTPFGCKQLGTPQYPPFSQWPRCFFHLRLQLWTRAPPVFCLCSKMCGRCNAGVECWSAAYLSVDGACSLQSHSRSPCAAHPYYPSFVPHTLLYPCMQHSCSLQVQEHNKTNAVWKGNLLLVAPNPSSFLTHCQQHNPATCSICCPVHELLDYAAHMGLHLLSISCSICCPHIAAHAVNMCCQYVGTYALHRLQYYAAHMLLHMCVPKG